MKRNYLMILALSVVTLSLSASPVEKGIPPQKEFTKTVKAEGAAFAYTIAMPEATTEIVLIANPPKQLGEKRNTIKVVETFKTVAGGRYVYRWQNLYRDESGINYAKTPKIPPLRE